MNRLKNNYIFEEIRGGYSIYNQYGFLYKSLNIERLTDRIGIYDNFRKWFKV